MIKTESLIHTMKQNKIDGYLLPRNNMFISEDIHPAENKIMKLCGFSGSAGTLLIIREGKSYLFVDGRYELQAPEETDSTEVEVICTTKISMYDWMRANLPEGFKLGLNPQTISIAEYSKLQNKLPQIKIYAIEELIDKDLPLVKGRVFEQNIEYAGISREEKIGNIMSFLNNHHKDGWLFCASDSVSWLLNLRAKCLPDTPIIRAYAWVGQNGEIAVFGGNLDFGKIAPNFATYNLTELDSFLKKHKKTNVYIDEKNTPLYIAKLAQKHKINLYQHTDICEIQKAVKNPIELQGIRKAHKRDALAVINFLYWLENNFEGQTELEIVNKLHEFRAQGKNFFSESFETIAAFGSNAAIVHYHPTAKTNKELKSGSLLLLDSGAQYYDGTTDITRTIAIGKPTQEMINNFTLVLKGHIRLNQALFPQGTTGQNLDALARLDLWKEGKDYHHGTGHGVGCFLNVHEGPLRISTSGSTYPLQAGMITSIEPGYYKENAYGIRIENLVEITANAQSNTLSFVPLTLVPIDKHLINDKLLNKEEKDWLNRYHERIEQTLSKELAPNVQEWLKQACAKI